LLEVVIGSESLLDVVLLHDDKGAAIDEGPRLVGAVLTESPGGLIGEWSNMNDLDVGAAFNNINDVGDLISGEAEGAVQQRNEFGNDVICSDDGVVFGAGVA
jgi:hypothetical protein